MKISRGVNVWYAVTALAMSMLTLHAASQSSGNFTVNASGNETGDLTVQGDAHFHQDLDFGTTGTSLSAGLLRYSESGTVYNLSIISTRAESTFLWQDNGVVTPKTKMILGGDNSLTLLDGYGASGIVLNPNTGLITLAGSGSGIRLSDGTMLTTSASLHGSALYTAGGTAAANVTTDGKVNFANGITLGSNNVASGTNAFASGNNAIATASTATALGEQTIAQSYDSLVLGRFNVAQGNATAWVPTDDLFVIGNGASAAAQSNALVVKKNGDTTISGKLEVTGRSKIQVDPQGDLAMGNFTAE